MTMRQIFTVATIALSFTLLALSIVSTKWLWGFIIIGPIILLGVYDMFQTRHSIRRLYPVLGRFRYMLESVRPEIQQYFIESDTSCLLYTSPSPRDS